MTLKGTVILQRRKQMHRELSNSPKITQLVSADLGLELRQAGSRVCTLNPYTVLLLGYLSYLSCLKLTFPLYEMGTSGLPHSRTKQEHKYMEQGPRIAGIC